MVREIFAMAQNGMRPKRISENLNQRGIHFSDSKPDWNRQTVANLIRNPVYAGCNAWGEPHRDSRKGTMIFRPINGYLPLMHLSQP